MTENKNTRFTRFGLFVITVFVFAASVVSIPIIVLRFKTANASGDWPTIQGTVIESRIQEHQSGLHASYKPIVRYEYSVNDEFYSGSVLSLSDYSSQDKFVARKIARKYPFGSNVTVYYNPDNPSEALLEPGFNVLLLFFLFIPIGLFVFGVAILKMHIHGVEKPCED